MAVHTAKDLLTLWTFFKVLGFGKGNLSVKLLRLKAFCGLHLRKGFYCKADLRLQQNLSAEEHKGLQKRFYILRPFHVSTVRTGWRAGSDLVDQNTPGMAIT